MKTHLRIVVLFVIIQTVFFVTNCATGVQRKSYMNYPGAPFFYRFQINSISVVVDRVKEDAIASQISVIVETYLNAHQNYDIKADETYLIDIIITQRSFMYDVVLYNTIYAAAIVNDKDGTILARENEYISGKKTIISTTEQNTIVKHILGRMLAKQKNRYAEIQKLLKKELKKNKTVKEV